MSNGHKKVKRTFFGDYLKRINIINMWTILGLSYFLISRDVLFHLV